MTTIMVMICISAQHNAWCLSCRY